MEKYLSTKISKMLWSISDYHMFRPIYIWVSHTVVLGLRLISPALRILLIFEVSKLCSYSSQFQFFSTSMMSSLRSLQYIYPRAEEPITPFHSHKCTHLPQPFLLNCTGAMLYTVPSQIFWKRVHLRKWKI